MSKYAGSRAKTYSYLIDDSSEDKKTEGVSSVSEKEKFKSENYKNCLWATQLEGKINYPEKNKINIQSLPKYFRQTVVFLWQNFNFVSKTEHQAIILWRFEIFLIFPNFLRS